MKELVSQKGQVFEVDTRQVVPSTGLFFWERWFRKMLKKYSLPFVSKCCPDSQIKNINPVGFDTSDNKIKYFDGTSWNEITL